MDCARSGARLSLWGRDSQRLAQTSNDCLAAGASAATTRALDLLKLDHALATLVEDDIADPFDMAIFASGLGDVRLPSDLFDDAPLIERLIKVNFLAPAVLASTLARQMTPRGKGKIALIGSVAAFHALPFAATYSASKAGLASFADALRLAMQPHGISVTLISPGFIDTAAAHRVPGPKPFILPPAQAAHAILSATMRGKAHLTTPWPFTILRWITGALPRVLRDRLLRSLTPPPTS